MTAAPGATERRRYTSARRQEQAAQTRLAVLEAATTLFSELGWSGTGMRDVAKEAGVSVETVYGIFGSKSDLLLAAIDVGVVGDDEPVPLSDRPEFAALAAGSLADRVAGAARMITEINERSWGLHRALREASSSEESLAARRRDLETRRRLNVKEGAELAVGRSLDDDVVDALWALLGSEVFHLLTQVGGRSIEQYEQWLRVTIARLLGP